MTIPVEQALPKDKTPFNESRALDRKLEGIVVTSSTAVSGRGVPVIWVGPDFELQNASYPGIYLSYAGVTRATDREVRGKTNLQYAPPGYPTDVQVPEDFEEKDSDTTVDWGEDGFSRLRSPYSVEDHPIPYNLDFNVTVLTRNYDQNFQIIAALQDIERLPPRFGYLEVPEDGTVRTLELLGGPDTSVLRDDDGKRVIQSLYSVRVAAELSLYEVQQVQRVASVEVDVHENMNNQYL